MSKYHHKPLPDYSTLLSGHTPPDDIGFPSQKLQIWYNNTDETWRDPAPHKHLQSDECFVVLKGSLLVEVEGERFMIGPREFCCFPAGIYHSIIESYPPLETLMIRAPSIEDKVYKNEL
jgi:mannose-6-phosphate isomerase-like protein (cupin superfamily)